MAIRKMAASGKTGNALDKSVMRLEPPARFDKQAPRAPAKGNVSNHGT